MASGQVRLTMAFNGEDKLAAVIEKSNRAMGKFGKNTSRVSKSATSGFARIKGSISGVGTRLTELNSGIQLARQAFGALQAAGEAAISGEIANNAEKVFNQISGGAENAAKIMEKLRGVSRGLLDDTTIQQFAGSLRIAGVEFSETARILDLSSRVALATGQDLETVSRKIKDAALAGRQGEFDRLGVVIKVNTELKKRAEAEGKVVEEMTKAEQVSMRMDILTEKLGTTMAAAGINTKDLSTNLRSVKTDLDNLQSTAEQTFANFLSPKEMEDVRNRLNSVAENVEEQAGGFSVSILKNDKLMRGYFADAAGLTLKEMDKALEGVDSFTAGFQGSQIAVVDAVVDQIIQVRKKRQAARTAEAKRAQEEGQDLARIKQEEIDFLLARQTDLEVEKVRIGEKGKKERLTLINEEIKGIEIALMELEGKGAGVIEKAQRMLSATIEANLAATRKEGKEKSKAAAKEAKDRRKAALEAIKKDAEQARNAARARLQASAESAQVKRDLELSFFQEDKDIKIRHGLEIEDLEKRKNTKLNLLVASSEEERQLERDRFMAEEVTLARTHGEELAAVQKALSEKKLKQDEKDAERAADILKRQREIFQEEMVNIANSATLIDEPLSALVLHERGVSEGLKGTASALAASSAAMQVYAHQTDASATAEERFVQGNASMISAGGKAASSFIKDARRKAWVQGSFEAASSVGAFASGNIVAGAGHAAAAGMFFALAKKTKGTPAGQASSNKSSLTMGGGGSSGLSATGGSGAIVVNVQGFALGSAREMGAKMAQTIDQARETGLDSSEV